MKDLFYRPDLKPKKDYMTDAVVEDEEEVSEEGTDPGQPDDSDVIESDIPDDYEDLEELVNDVDEIINVSNILPEGIRETIVDNLELIKEDLNNIVIPDYPTIEPIRVSDVPPTPSLEPRGDRPKISLFPDVQFTPIEVVPIKPVRIVINEVYDIDRIQIYRDFIKDLKVIITKYIQELLYLASISGMPSYKDLLYTYSIPSDDLPENYRHVGDSIVRTQVGRDQKSRLFRKVYNVEQTIYHLRANKVAHELRTRYYADSKYQQGKDYLSTNSNDLLRDSRLQYDKRYENNMYNFYKYLNSSSIMVNDILQSFIKEAKGKAILHKQGVDINKGFKEEQVQKEKKETENRKKEEEAFNKQKEEEQKRLNDLANAGKSGDNQFYVTYGGSGYSDGTSSGGSSVVNPGDMSLPSDVSGDGNKVAELAIHWFKTRGKGSSNPVIYSMAKRGSDMNLNRYGDCSSFSRKVHLDAGKGDIGWTTAQQVTNSKKGQFIANLSDIQPGDCMYFSPTSSHAHKVTLPNGKRTSVAHVAIYVGNQTMVHLNYGSGTITMDSFASGYYKKYVTNNFIGAMRF